MTRISFEQQRQKVVALLKEHAVVYQAGMQDAAVNATQEFRTLSGPMLINKAAFKRHFSDSDNARSHQELEKHLARMREMVPRLSGAIDDMHFRSTAGDSDPEFVRRLAEKGSEDARLFMRLYDWALDVLALRLWGGEVGEYMELDVEFAKPHSIREHKKAEDRNAALYADHQRNLSKGMTKGESVKNLITLYGLEKSRVYEIIQARDSGAESGEKR